MRLLKSLLPLFALAAPTLHPLAVAATLCVNSSGGYPCYPTITSALEAAADGDVINVGSGTYAEAVFVNKAVSLTTQNAVIDATGLPRGIFINGMGVDGGLAGVNVSGFTVRNARFEGILVVNASAVTVSNNMVINNDQARSDGTCPGLNDFESVNEASDCGEGIHLMGADHAVVTNNTVQGNAGGILLSDDTGATHDNLVSFNSVSNNPYASGITLASNAVALMVQTLKPLGKGLSDGAGTGTGPATMLGSYGVYHNTVYANRSNSNGLANASGAGVGIFATFAGTSAYGNVVVANYLTQNALPGVALHAQAQGDVMTDNLIVGNTLVNNGADTAAAATPGPTGVNVYALTAQSGNMIIGNAVQGESVDVAVHMPAQLQVEFNSLGGNGNGVANLGIGSVLAAQNFWSCPNGPTIPGSCSLALGSNIQTAPWLTMQLPAQPNF